MEWFSGALAGGGGLGLAAAALLGVTSVLLSPCHLASVPLVIAVVGRRAPEQRSLSVALGFGLGVLASFLIVGGLTVALGRVAGDIGPWATWAGAALFVVLGLDTLEVIRVPWIRPATSHPALRGAHPTLIGLAFGATLGPCTFAFMAPVLGTAFSLAEQRPVFAAGLVATFSLAHAALLTAAGASGDWTMRYLAHRGAAKVVGALRIFMGVLLVGAGLYLVAFGR